ncbi:hypothetical protein EAH79_01610 [Sphingomonas koreensis]|nr:hypothetical protein EAH79_01610 [Sphingomonas koreensis]
MGPLADCDAERFCAVSSVKPNMPAAGAGIVPGDRVRLDHFWERRRTLPPGEAVGMTVRPTGGSERHISLVTAPRSFFALTWIIDGLASAAVCLVALLILARAGRRRWSFLLGSALIGIGVPGGYPRFWQNDHAIFPWFFVGLAVLYMAGPVLMLAALRGFRREMTGSAPRWLGRLLAAVASGTLVATVWGTAVELDSAPLLGISNGLLLTSSVWSLGWLLAPFALIGGWHKVGNASRTRYAFMWVAVAATAVHPIVDPIIQATGNDYNNISWAVVVQLLSTITGATLFAYAILRHRVVDLGFAINRTLVYSTFSFVTLVAFGLVELASEKLLPLESHEASAAIEAGVALSLFLLFHRIHGSVEHAVERLFFHRWHANEAEVRRFLHRASYITKPAALLDGVTSELRRFSGGAEVAFYRAASAGYERVWGGGADPVALDADIPALVAMRADRSACRDAFTSGDLALPMTHRADVTGFALLGAKPTGDPYRPDEEALLAEVVHRIGLDLYALRVEELEVANAQLTQKLEALAGGRIVAATRRRLRPPAQ